MGQYYYVANLDKKEYLHPHHCGDGPKLMEFGLSSCGNMSCLAILLADGNGRGGGDLRSDNPIVGSWAGNRIVITGDYADNGRFGAPEDCNLMSTMEDWRNVSSLAIEALADDVYAKQQIRKPWGHQ
jgi:hypothetical protein